MTMILEILKPYLDFDLFRVLKSLLRLVSENAGLRQC